MSWWDSVTSWPADRVAGASTPTIRPPGNVNEPNGYPAPTGPVGPGADQFAAAQNRLATRRALIGYGNPNNPYRVGVTRADQAVMDSQRTQNGLRRALVPQNYGLLDLEGRQIQQERGLTDLQGRQLQQQGAYYGESAADIAARQGENQRLQTAQNDVADIQAVGQANAYRSALNHGIYDAIGEVRPTEVVLPSSARGTALTGGLVAANRSNADYVNEDNRAADTTRGLALEGSRNALDQTGNQVATYRNSLQYGENDISGARNRIAYGQQGIDAAGLDTEDARLNEQGWRSALSDATDQAQYEDQLAGLTSDELRLGPSYGEQLYTNPRTRDSEYLSPWDYEQRQFQDQQSQQLDRIPANYDASRARTQYANQQQGRLGGYSESDLASMWQTGQLGASASDIEATIQYFRGLGLDETTAQQKAALLINQARERAIAAQQAREKAASGGANSGPPIALPPRPSATPKP